MSNHAINAKQDSVGEIVDESRARRVMLDKTGECVDARAVAHVDVGRPQGQGQGGLSFHQGSLNLISLNSLCVYYVDVEGDDQWFDVEPGQVTTYSWR